MTENKNTPFQIGNVTIPGRVIFAPMAGVSDLPFRLLCREQGAALVCMEMISAKAITYHNARTADLMETSPAEAPVSLQLFGCEPEVMTRACELIDIESCVDYYATEIYVANQDWPRHNVSLWRARKPAAGEYADGKWRWILFDVNLAMDSRDMNLDGVTWTLDRDSVFASLMDSPEFSSALEDKLVELATYYFNPGRVGDLITDYENRMADAMEVNYRRFYDDTRTREDFIESCEDIRRFYEGRYAYIMGAYGDGHE